MTPPDAAPAPRRLVRPALGLAAVIVVLGVLAALTSQALFVTQARAELDRDVDRAHVVLQVMLDSLADGPIVLAAAMRAEDDPAQALDRAVRDHGDDVFGEPVLVTGGGAVVGDVAGLPSGGGRAAARAVREDRPVWSTVTVDGRPRLVVTVPCRAWPGSAVELLVPPLELGARDPFTQLSLTLRLGSGPAVAQVGPPSGGAEVVRALELGGLVLAATYGSHAPLLPAPLSWVPLVVLVLAVLLASCVAWTVGALARSRRAALETVATQTVELRRLAYVDELTGLANRRALTEHLQSLVEGPGAVAVALVDVDFFKQHNDLAGHDSGDALLRLLAQRLAGLDAFAARLGGDEFVVVVPADDRDGARALGRLLQSVLQEPGEVQGAFVRPSVSIGVHLAPGAVGGQALLKGADKALYAAKRAGRGCWRTSAPVAVGHLLPAPRAEDRHEDAHA